MLVVVTGATGRTGRRIVPRLTAAGAVVRAVGRVSDPRHDWTDPSTWPAVLAPDDAGVPPAAVYRAYAPSAFRDGLLARGLPAEEADGLAGLFTELVDGRNATPTDGVRRALGRAPRAFAESTAAAFRTGVAR